MYAEVRGKKVYYQVAYEEGSLRCYHWNSSSSVWLEFKEDANHYDDYAECSSSWTKGNPDCTIKLTLNGNTYITNEHDAIQNGEHPNSGITYIIDLFSLLFLFYY